MQKVLAEIVRAVGPDLAVKLCLKWGRGSVYVPQDIGAAHPISKQIGVQAARRLSKSFGGSKLCPPTVENAFKAIGMANRNEAIFRAVAGGRTRTQVAEDYGLTRQAVAAILKKCSPHAGGEK